MIDREKVIGGLKKLHENSGCIAVHDCDCKACPYERVNGCCDKIIEDALELLKAQEPPTVRECKDLQVLRDIKSGKVLKSGCKEYVIYNGDWYRTHKWDAPQEPVEPVWHGGENEHIGFYACGSCGMNMGTNPNYCWYCGKKVKWE